MKAKCIGYRGHDSGLLIDVSRASVIIIARRARPCGTIDPAMRSPMSPRIGSLVFEDRTKPAPLHSLTKSVLRADGTSLCMISRGPD